MELFKGMSANHEAMRGACARVGVLLARPCGVGWDERMALDQRKLSREIASLLVALRLHDAMEAAYMELVYGELETDRKLIGAVAEGHGAVGDMARLLSTVAFLCDGEHVHRLRTVQERLREEMEAHLGYAETVVLPRLRAKLSDAQLEELWLRAFAVPAAAPERAPRRGGAISSPEGRRP